MVHTQATSGDVEAVPNVATTRSDAPSTNISKTVRGQVESTTGGAAATISAVGCNAQHHLHAHKTDDLGEHEGDLSQPDTSGKPPLTPPKASTLNLTP